MSADHDVRDGDPGDARFYERCGPFSLSEVAAAAGGTTGAATGATDHSLSGPLFGIAPLRAARAGEVSFVNARRHRPALAATAAGAVIVPAAMLADVPAGTSAIVCPDPDEAWANVAALFHPVRPSAPGTHPSASVAPGARVDPSAEIGAFTEISEGAEVGPGCRVGSHVSIGRGVRLGADCRVGAHVSISHAVLGDRVCLFPGVRIGQEGFGFSHSPRGFRTAPQLGRVVIGDDVEVGANSTIDRGSIQDTAVGAGTRIDNLVQIAHNVRLGRCCVIVAQVGIAGSTVLGDFVQVGGQAALAPHLTIGAGAQIGAQAGVIADVPPGAILLGSPAQPRKEFFRGVAVLRRLARKGADGGQA